MLSSSGIYKIICIKNKKVYIGSAVDLQKRKREHFSSLKAKTHFNRYLQSCFNMYGEQSFIFEIVLYCEKEFLLLNEEEQIKIHDSFNNGFNLVEKPSKNMLGFKHAEESKKKMSDSGKQRGRHKHSCSLSTKDVQEIRQKFFNGTRVSALSKEYNVHRKTIKECVYLKSYSDIKCEIEGYSEMLKEIHEQRNNGKRPRSSGWKHTEDFIERFRISVTGPKQYARKLSDEQVKDIRKEKEKGSTCRDLAQKYNVNQNTISRICRRLIYSEIL
jgi:Mor family transcriptional regulator